MTPLLTATRHGQPLRRDSAASIWRQPRRTAPFAAWRAVKTGAEPGFSKKLRHKEVDRFKQLPVRTDGSRLSHRAINMAMTLAKIANARLTVLHIVPRINPAFLTDGYAVGMDATDEYEAVAREQGAKYLKKAESAAARLGLRCQTRLVTSMKPHKAIIDTARSRNCDVIVMASHGRGNLSALLMGSETTQVLANCRRPVLVVR
jgi:nucleotide-binding universal stress UspA family protein